MREPSSRIHFGFIAGDIVSNNLDKYIGTEQVIYDFVHKREILVSTYDECRGVELEDLDYWACVLNVSSKEAEYHLMINNRATRLGDVNYDLLHITFKDFATNTSSTAIYGDSGHLTSIRTDSDIGRRFYGNLSWRNKNYDDFFALDLIDGYRWYSYRSGYSLGEEGAGNGLVYEIKDSGRLNFSSFSTRRYICSLPFDGESKSPVYFETSGEKLKIVIERPDEVCKTVEVPLSIPKFDAYGMQHVVPKAIVEFPYNLFRNFIIDNIVPVAR